MSKVKGNTNFDDYNFVIFFPCDWETPWRGRYLIEALSKLLPNSKILCIENFKDLLISLIKNPLNWFKKNKTYKVKDNLLVFQPFIFLNVHLAAKVPFLESMNVKWLKRQLLSVMHKYNFNSKTIITWVADPFHESFIGMFDEKLSIYDCYDEYTSVKGWPIIRTKRQIIKHERRLFKKVDLSFVVSDALYKTKNLYANKMVILPNAVDTEHFFSLDNNKIADLTEISEISKPIIGYLGGLSDKVDIPMLCILSEKHPEWSFVLIGPTLQRGKKSQAFSRFIQKPNIHVIGSRSYEELPHYLNTFDVCFLPLVIDHPFNINCSPLKLYEYLATGKPIVSTDIPYVGSFRDLVRIGKSTEEIEDHINDCINERGGLKEKRIAMAKENKWEKRVTDMLDITNDTIKENNVS